MKRPSLQRFWLCVPTLVAYGFDVTLTLAGQNPQYWTGDYRQVEEFNPLAKWVLQIHPGLFLLLALLWAFLFCLLLFLWRNSLVVVIGFVFTLCHSVGAGTWMIRLGWIGYGLVVVFFVAMERFLTFCWRRAGVGDKTNPHLKRKPDR